MAFTFNGTLNGADCIIYAKIAWARADTTNTLIQLLFYTSQESRDAGAHPVPDNWHIYNPIPQVSSVLQDTDEELLANPISNAVELAYRLLKQSDLYPDATWNV